MFGSFAFLMFFGFFLLVFVYIVSWDFLVFFFLHSFEWINAIKACVLKTLFAVGRRPYILIEQPAQSWAFKQTFMKELAQLAGLRLGCATVSLCLVAVCCSSGDAKNIQKCWQTIVDWGWLRDESLSSCSTLYLFRYISFYFYLFHFLFAWYCWKYLENFWNSVNGDMSWHV